MLGGDPSINIGPEYDPFGEFSSSESKAAELMRENASGGYKAVLVNQNQLLCTERRTTTSCDPLHELYNFIPGSQPFIQFGNAGELFSPLSGIPVDRLKVRAVLHPLYGLPKVLLEEKDI